MTRSEIFLLVLRVEKKQVDVTVCRIPIVDDSESYTLSLVAKCPAKLAKASTPPNQSSLLRPQGEGKLKSTVVIVKEKPVELVGKDGRLYEPYSSTIRH